MAIHGKSDNLFIQFGSLNLTIYFLKLYCSHGKTIISNGKEEVRNYFLVFSLTVQLKKIKLSRILLVKNAIEIFCFDTKAMNRFRQRTSSRESLLLRMFDKIGNYRWRGCPLCLWQIDIVIEPLKFE